MQEMYTEKELLQITNQILTDYENAMEASHRRFYKSDESKPYVPQIPALVKRTLDNPQLSPEIRTILENLIFRTNINE